MFKPFSRTSYLTSYRGSLSKLENVIKSLSFINRIGAHMIIGSTGNPGINIFPTKKGFC